MDRGPLLLPGEVTAVLQKKRQEMMMLQYIKAIKQAFRDKYGFQPVEGVFGDELVFPDGEIPDGEYPMEINGRLDNVKVEGGHIHCCRWS